MTDYKKISETLSKAIDNQENVTMTIKYSDGKPIEVGFDPYMSGDDLMQHEYIWGYLTDSMAFYKFRLTDIIQVKNEKKKFKVLDWATYYYGTEEVCFHITPDFDTSGRMYLDSHIGR